jgi:hypothetical protein
MDIEKYKGEVATLKKFFEIYCNDEHTNQTDHCKQLNYKDTKINVELHLCTSCIKLIDYSFDRLSECPHNPKPRCRTCKTPCYSKEEWKKVPKLMRYSGIKLGLLRIKKFFLNQILV